MEPISTVPKDGGPVYLIFDSNPRLVACAYFVPEQGRFWLKELRNACINVTWGETPLHEGDTKSKATHWMPIPEPPAA